MVREGADLVDLGQKQRNPLGGGLRGRVPGTRFSGVDEDRTHNLLDATEALFQLSYHPSGRTRQSIRLKWAPQGVTGFRCCLMGAQIFDCAA